MMKRSFKIGLVSLLFGFVGLIGFGYCEDEMMYLDHVVSQDFQGYVWDTYYENLDVDMLCLKNKTCNNGQLSFSANHTGTGKGLEDGNIGGLGFCTTDGIIYYSLSSSSCSITIDGYNFHQLTSEECQNEYDLIPSSDVDTNYCVENDLCPVSTGSASWSELMINDIVHESAPFINISIPYEYAWDYTVDENEFNLVVSGYNVDYEYIDGIIRTQQSKPNQVDFNNIVSGLIPLLIPGLVIILFIYFVFRFIKKIF